MTIEVKLRRKGHAKVIREIVYADRPIVAQLRAWGYDETFEYSLPGEYRDLIDERKQYGSSS